KDERHPVPPQQRDKDRVEEALMADLDGVPQLAPAPGLSPGALGEPFAAAFGECCRGLGVSGEKREEMVEALGREAEARRELPQAGAELLLKPQDAGSKEIGERRLDLAQSPAVGDEPRTIDGGDK